MPYKKQSSGRRATLKSCAFFAGIAAAANSGPALAYLDPGTGSIILQGLFAGIAAVVAAGSMFWHRIKTMFASLFPRKKSPATETVQPSDD